MPYLPATFPIIAILGPTAVGKTEISLRIAQELNAEIVNYDSVQLYKYLDIGSAKPTAEERAVVPHHLLDVMDPDEPNDVAKFVHRATTAIKRIRMRGKNVILVGGTNMYLESLLNGLTPCPGQHPGIRSTLHFIVKSQGSHFLHEYLQNIDPESAERIHPNDHTRLFRAIEVFAQSGIPISTWHNTWHAKGGISHRYEVLKLGLICPIEELYERINRRVDIMIKTGFIEEVQQLLQMGYSPKLNALQTLGYRHIIQYLHGKFTLIECIEYLKRDHRHYARRQLIWMRADAKIHWFNPMALKRQRAIWPYIHTRGTN